MRITPCTLVLNNFSALMPTTMTSKCFLFLFQVFSDFGKIISIRLVRDIVTGLSKRYAFIVYETADMALNAYSHCKSLVLNNFKVFVDFECGRLLPGWKPRRLGIVDLDCYYSTYWTGFQTILLFHFYRRWLWW